MEIRDRIRELRRVRAGDLIPHPKNWRTHPESQRSVMRGLLSEVGYADALLTRETPDGLQLIDGHLRREMTPDTTVPVLVTDLDEAEAEKLLATLDPLAAMAAVDGERLRDLLASVQTNDASVRALLQQLNKDAAAALAPRRGHTDPDEVPPVPETPTTQPGDLWLLGEHRLLCGDATKREDVARLMDGQQAALVYTDPPYGVAYDGGAKRRERLAGDQVGTSIYADSLPMLSVAADKKAALYLWYADAGVATAVAAAGYTITASLVWLKNNAQFVTSAHYKGKHEACFYAHRDGQSARWYGPNNEVTVWECDRAPRNDFHPTQKPVELAVRAMRNSSQPGDIVLDLFGGSGSTIIAAHQSQRRCYTMEIDARYVDTIVARWQNHSQLKAVRADAISIVSSAGASC